MESNKKVVFQLHENGFYTITCSDIVELKCKVYKLIYKLVDPKQTLDTPSSCNHYDNMACDCSCSFPNKTNKVLFEMYEDGTFSIISCSDLEAVCNMVYKKIYKTVKTSTTVDSILARRQARLEAYRREYEMNQKPNRYDEGEDEIDG